MRSVSNNIRNLRRFGFKWDFQAILIYISRRVTWLSFFLSVSASRFFLAENSRGKEDGGERIYIPGELFYSICNSNRLAASVEEECKCLCVRSRASEREREREREIGRRRIEEVPRLEGENAISGKCLSRIYEQIDFRFSDSSFRDRS